MYAWVYRCSYILSGDGVGVYVFPSEGQVPKSDILKSRPIWGEKV